ncbi:MAG: sodium:calcium antiporter [Candidatus Azotimanducaceae bacterium WSBS_2022_MAG_OTU7]
MILRRKWTGAWVADLSEHHYAIYCAGVITLPLGADLVVEGGIGLASSWGVSEAVIGLSLIALGTSLPELSTTVIAALHKSSDVAIGNVVGSNLFNILAILGITSLLTDIVDPEFLQFDLWVMLGCSIILWIFVLTKGTINRATGGFFLVGYFSYLAFIY